jgi:hypothetical protein
MSVGLTDNRFLSSGTPGVSLYRVNDAYVGYNSIQGPGQGDGVSISNTINSWVYGNQIFDVHTAVSISGTPDEQSHWGACYNGVDRYYDKATETFPEALNTFQAQDNVCFSQDACRDSRPQEARCFTTGLDALQAGY